MTWTDLITCGIDEAYKASDNLMSLVKDDELDWKPATGKNWMTVGQLLKHMTEACGLCCKGFVTGDWGLPEGMDDERSAAGVDVARGRKDAGRRPAWPRLASSWPPTRRPRWPWSPRPARRISKAR